MNPLIAEREATHGDFASKARFIQIVKALIRDCPNWEELSPGQREALELIATKLGRILHGNPNEPDHWADVAGYADLGAIEIAKGMA